MCLLLSGLSIDRPLKRRAVYPVNWIQDYGCAVDIVRRELRSTRSGVGARSLEGVNEDYIRKGHDREARTSATLSAFVDVLRARGILGPAHLAMPLLTNVLAEPHRVIADGALSGRILDMKAISATNMRLHLLALFKKEYGGLTQADLDEHFGGKAPKSRTSRKRRVLSFLEASGDSTGGVGPVRKKRILRAEAVKRVSRRRAEVLKVVSILSDVCYDPQSSSARVQSANLRQRAAHEV